MGVLPSVRALLEEQIKQLEKELEEVRKSSGRRL